MSRGDFSGVGTIPELFESAVERSGSAPWLTFEGSTYSYEHAYERVGAVAARLAEYGVRRGDRVLATARNEPRYLFTWLGVTSLGAVIAAVDPDSTPAELRALVSQLTPSLIVTGEDLRTTVEEGAPASAAGRVISVDALARAPASATPHVDSSPGDIAVMIPTSGTTGRPKLVMQTHGAYVLAAEGFPFWLGLSSKDRLMTALPLFHLNAPAYSVLGSLAAGARLILLRRFSAERFFDEARRYGATEFNAIGAMLEILMRRPARTDDANNPIRLCFTGPSPSRQRQLEIEERFGFEIVCGYALSESPYGLVWRRGTRPYGTLGSARQHPRLGVINHARVLRDDGSEAQPGEVGELELNNPAIMAGYFDMPEETSRVVCDGWLRTGDLVRVNADGTYTFVARRKEIIRRRGENLSPVEVEVALESHPDVVEAAVIGVPSELSEEEVKAFVVPVPGATLNPWALREFVATRVSAFKVPRYMETVASLPHTATGRVAKRRLPRERTPAEVDLAQPASADERAGT